MLPRRAGASGIRVAPVPSPEHREQKAPESKLVSRANTPAPVLLYKIGAGTINLAIPSSAKLQTLCCRRMQRQ